MSKVAHSLTAKILNWWYCRHCGLILLNNDDTRKAARAPCDK